MIELMRVTEGDMRRAIQMLQSLHQLHGGRIEPQAVHDASGNLPRPLVLRTFAVCRGQNFDAMESLVTETLADGYPAEQLIQQMLDAMLSNDGPAGGLSSAQKAKIAANYGDRFRCIEVGRAGGSGSESDRRSAVR